MAPPLTVALVSLALSGCNQQARWDREYACNGQEQAAGLRKQYPITIDFHVRTDRALAKSHQTRVESTVGGVIGSATSSASV